MQRKSFSFMALKKAAEMMDVGNCEDYRPVILERGVLSTTNGSARVRIDETDLLLYHSSICSGKLNNKIMKFLNFELSVDYFSQKCQLPIVGKGGESFAEDIVSALEASYDNLHVLTDMNKNHIWVVYIDIIILQCGGSTIDAASIGFLKYSPQCYFIANI
uniref:Ribosomal RNA-processing protein 42 n=1 Tax=Heterorhabditis bacteriophora TaxID=37862 RepID=A0A1I7W8K8_HETBA